MQLNKTVLKCHIHFNKTMYAVPIINFKVSCYFGKCAVIKLPHLKFVIGSIRDTIAYVDTNSVNYKMVTLLFKTF